MDMIEVDPKLFVTCRLCLEELGHFQIVPSVQKQIKYCFDIDVAPFDGLPQLICEKCKQVLINFFAIKEALCEKQNKLIKQIINVKDTSKIYKPVQDTGIQPQQEAVSSSQQPTKTTEKKKPTFRSKRVIDSSDSETSQEAVQAQKKSKISRNKTRVSPKWDSTGYKKCYVCRVCESSWPCINSFGGHFRRHVPLKAIYPTIFQRNCAVILNKLDDKPNLTGTNSLVVHNDKKIIQNCNALYYIKYLKQKNNISGAESISSASLNTDSEDEIVSKPKKKRIRVLSRSSNDTVVIESNSNKVGSDNEDDNKVPPQETKVAESETTTYQCINIDDSSDSDADQSQTELTQRVKQPIEAQLNDYKIIQGIITMCVNAYHRKNETCEKSDNQGSSESQLKHKVLSIGRKIINRQGVNFTGLLRYLEHKNLDIVWATKTMCSGNRKDTNYVRIMTKLRGKEIIDDDYGWVPVTNNTVTLDVEPDSSLSITRNTTPIIENFTNAPSENPDSAVLLICSPPDPRNKLLNANPVANPKQLPKKLGQTEPRFNKLEQNVFQNVEDNNSFMPIITSATSLADPKSADKKATGSTPEVDLPTIDKPAPRIKVKPASELMSERTLLSLQNASSTSNILANQTENTEVSSSIEQISSLVINPINGTKNLLVNQNIWSSQNQLTNIYSIPSIQLVPITCLDVNPGTTFASPTVLNTPPTNLTSTTPTNLTSTTPTNLTSQGEAVLLHTNEFPNTKTYSPFKYVQSLLGLYNLILLDSTETVPRDFICLIKFKVQFKQERIKDQLVFCLFFFCLKNKFCFKVRDESQTYLDLSKISANWQWEIINVFRGDLVDKLLANAQKHSQETRDCTNKFLCLLKSIKCSKLST